MPYSIQQFAGTWRLNRASAIAEPEFWQEWEFWIAFLELFVLIAIATLTVWGVRAAWSSNKVAKSTLAGNLRPWLSLTTNVSTGWTCGITGDDDNTYIEFGVTLRNFGKSPALAVRIGGQLYLERPDKPLEQEFELFRETTIGTRGVRCRDLYPGDSEKLKYSVGASTTKKFSAQRAWAKAANRADDPTFEFNQRWFVFLKVQYESAHSDSPDCPHRTADCFTLTRPPDPANEFDPYGQSEIFFADPFDAGTAEISRYGRIPYSAPD